MSRTPGTVSKILWHFTGGPKWDETAQRQSKQRKSNSKAFKALKGILNDRILRCGSYNEVVNGVISSKLIEKTENPRGVRYSYGANYHQIQTSKVCCLTDIPVQHLQYHAQRYGKFAVGFHRKKVVDDGFNPVLYSLEDSTVTKRVLKISEALGTDLVFDVIQDLKRSLLDHQELFEFRDQIEAIVQSVVSEHAWDTVEVPAYDFRNLATFIKTFTNEEFDSIYCEREWRNDKDFIFDIDDVAMIVIPRTDKYLEKFIAEFQHLPRTIPIIAWEDLIEH